MMKISQLLQFIISITLVVFSLIIKDITFSVVVLILIYLINLKLNSTQYLSDPRNLFLGFYVVYAIIFPLRIITTGLTILPMDINILMESLIYQNVALVVMITVFNIRCSTRGSSEERFFENNSFKNLGYKAHTSEKLVSIIVFISVLIGGVLVIKSGASSKRDLLDSNLGANALIEYIILFGLINISLRALRVVDEIEKDFLIYLFLSLLLINMLITGERDSLFRLIILLLFIYFDFHKKANNKTTVCLLLLAVFIVPISQLFKSILLSGVLLDSKLGLELLLSNEFVSAGQNLYSLNYYNVEHSLSYIFTDIIRAFLPSFVSNQIGVESTVSWFNNTYRVENGFSGTAGWGFGIVPQGYLIGGVLGVILISCILSIFISHFYRKSFKSDYYYVFYLCLLTTSIYVLRGDLANLLSQSIKINGILVITLFLLHKFFKRLVK